MDINFVNDIIVPIGVGFLASIICTIGFYRLFRPRVEISKYLSLDSNGKISFKIANKSHFWRIYDISIHTYLCSYNAKEQDKEVISLHNTFQDMSVSQLYPNKKKYLFSNHAVVGINIKHTAEAEALLVNGTELVVQVVASHGWSCVRNAIVQTYQLPCSIKTAPFCKGNNTDIEFNSPERILPIWVDDKKKIFTFTRNNIN